MWMYRNIILFVWSWRPVYMVKFDSTVAKTGTTQIIRRGHIQFKFGSHNLNFLTPPWIFHNSLTPELSLHFLKLLNPPKISHPPPKKNLNPSRKDLNSPQKNLTPSRKKSQPFPEKSQPEISQPSIYLMVLVNGTFTKQSYKGCIAHSISYIARQSILNYE